MVALHVVALHVSKEGLWFKELQLWERDDEGVQVCAEVYVRSNYQATK